MVARARRRQTRQQATRRPQAARATTTRRPQPSASCPSWACDSRWCNSDPTALKHVLALQVARHPGGCSRASDGKSWASRGSRAVLKALLVERTPGSSGRSRVSDPGAGCPNGATRQQRSQGRHRIFGCANKGAWRLGRCSGAAAAGARGGMGVKMRHSAAAQDADRMVAADRQTRPSASDRVWGLSSISPICRSRQVSASLARGNLGRCLRGAAFQAFSTGGPQQPRKT